MSSRLPAALLSEFDQRYRLPDGLYRCARCHRKVAQPDMQRDHIKPEWSHPELAYDVDNLQPLCAPRGGGGCHREKTAKEAGARARVARRRPWPHRLVLLGLGGGLVWLGVAFAGNGILTYTGGDAAAWLAWHLGAAKTALAALLAVTVLMWWIRAGLGSQRRERPPTDREAELKARITAEAREVLGERGSVTVTEMEWRS